MKKMLILLPYIPYPLDSGGNNVIFSEIDKLRGEVELSLAFDVRSHGYIPKASAEKVKLVEQLQALWPNVTFYLYKGQRLYWEEPYPKNLISKVFQELGNSFLRKQRRSYAKWSQRHSEGDAVRACSSICNSPTYYNPGFLRFVQDVVQKGFDIIQVEMYEYLFLGYLLPKSAYRVFVHHELRFVRYANEVKLFKERGGNDTLAYEYAKALELDALKSYDHVITLTNRDKTVLSKYLPQERITASPIILSPNEQSLPFKACTDFVFVGSGAHFPNKDAMQWFAEEILPLLRQKNISLRLFVVGKWNKRSMRAIAQDNPEIVFTGFVDNLPEFLNGKISIVPLRIGSGMRIKILESVQAHSPFITTSKGVEGLPFRHQQECLVAEDSAHFAAAMISLQESAELQQNLSQAARALFREQYSSQVLLDIRKRVYNLHE